MNTSELNSLKLCWYAPWFSALRSNYLKLLEQAGMDCLLVTSTAHFDPAVDVFEKAKIFNLKVRGWRRLRTLVDIYREINAFNPDALICDMPSRVPQCVLTYSLLLSKKGLVAIDDVIPHDEDDSPNKFVTFLQKAIVRRAIGIITFSQNSASLAKLKYSGKSVFPVPLLPEISSFAKFRPLPSTSRENFAMVGRWSEYKGLDLGIAFFQEYKKRYISESVLDLWCSGLEQPVIDDPSISWKSFSSFTWESLVEILPNYKAILVPYRSASQSGVQILSWDAGVPCLISNLPGLIELQPSQVPAVDLTDMNGWIEAIHKIDKGHYSENLGTCGQTFSRSIRMPSKVVEGFKPAILCAVGRG